MLRIRIAVLPILLSLAAAAQTPTSVRPGTRPPAGAPAASAPAAASATSAPTALNQLMAQLQQTASDTDRAISRLRIEKWKTDSSSKQQAQSNAESVQRNISAALPGLIAQMRNAPDSMAAGFKLYRNLNALYDVLTSLTESAGAFGSKEEYQALANDASALDQNRRDLGSQLESMATSHDAELTRFRAQARSAAAAPPTPKKIIVDNDTTPVKKTKKKKPAADSGAQTPQ